MRDWTWDDGEDAYPPKAGTGDEEKKPPATPEGGRTAKRGERRQDGKGNDAEA